MSNLLRTPLLLRATLLAAVLATSILLPACGGGGPPPAEVTPLTIVFTPSSKVRNVTLLVREIGKWEVTAIELSGTGAGQFSRLNTCDGFVFTVNSPTPATCVETVQVFGTYESGKAAVLTVRGKKVGGTKIELEERVNLSTA